MLKLSTSSHPLRRTALSQTTSSSATFTPPMLAMAAPASAQSTQRPDIGNESAIAETAPAPGSGADLVGASPAQEAPERPEPATLLYVSKLLLMGD
jgi:hypothetical protein